MTDFGAATDLIILVIVSFIPALIYLSWIRRTERYGREAWGPLLRAFAFGAFFATITAAILEGVIVYAGTAVSQTYPGPEFLFLNGNSTAGAFFLVLVVAPFVEEALKASGVVSGTSRGSSSSPTDRCSARRSASASGSSRRSSTAWAPSSSGASRRGSRSSSCARCRACSCTEARPGCSATATPARKFGGRDRGPGRTTWWRSECTRSFNALASLAAILALAGVTVSRIDAAGYLALLAAIFFAFWAIEHVRSIIQASDYPALLGATIPYKPPAKTRPPSGR